MRFSRLDFWGNVGSGQLTHKINCTMTWKIIVDIFFSFSCARIYMSRISCKTTHPLHISRPTRLIPFFNYNQGSGRGEKWFAQIATEKGTFTFTCIYLHCLMHLRPSGSESPLHKTLQIRAQYNFHFAPSLVFSISKTW